MNTRQPTHPENEYSNTVGATTLVYPMHAFATASPRAVLAPIIYASIAAQIPGARRIEGLTAVEYLAPEGSEIQLTTAEEGFTIGRSKESSNLYLEYVDVSRNHARISSVGGQFTLSDLGSLNGTFLNEQRLEAHNARTLTSGDKIRFGTAAIYLFLGS
jgi:pSer/pThr/pTyr-binding forkhead associated (FHA) protein